MSDSRLVSDLASDNNRQSVGNQSAAARPPEGPGRDPKRGRHGGVLGPGGRRPSRLSKSARVERRAQPVEPLEPPTRCVSLPGVEGLVKGGLDAMAHIVQAMRTGSFATACTVLRRSGEELGGPFSFCPARRRFGQAVDELGGPSQFRAARTVWERGVGKLYGAFLFYPARRKIGRGVEELGRPFSFCVARRRSVQRVDELGEPSQFLTARAIRR